MPEGRLIKRKIVDDYRLNNVPIEAELLFYKLILLVDREGRFEGDPKVINKQLYTLREYTTEQVDGWLDELWTQKKHGKGLIERYEVEEHQYIYLPGFEGEQSATWRKTFKDREAESHIPPPDIKTPRKEVKKPDTSAETIVDEKLKGIVDCYEAHIGMVTPAISDRLKDITNTYPDGWFEKAVAEAVQYGARGHNLRYIEKILERWKVEGISPSGPESKDDEGNIAGLKVEE